jgi:lipooligosaccharide transport system permease protein
MMVERNLLVYRRLWLALVSGFFEPVFYLLSIGVGIGALIGGGIVVAGRVVDYTAFVAPALLASSAMNGAIYDSTFSVFFKLKYAKTYDAMLATPLAPADVALGEVCWALLRGTLYAIAFLLVMGGLGLLTSPWAILALPAALLIGFAFAGAGMAASCFMRSWQDFEWVNLVVLPMFLLSTTFYPLETYPGGLRPLVAATPLYQGVELMRGLTLGDVGLHLLTPVVYLLALGTLGLVVAGRRLGRLLLR